MNKRLLIGLFSTELNLIAPPKDNHAWKPCTDEMKADSRYQSTINLAKKNEQCFFYGIRLVVMNGNQQYRELTPAEQALPFFRSYCEQKPAI